MPSRPRAGAALRRALALLAVGAIALVSTTPDAVADPLDDKKAEAARIASRIEELNREIERWAEAAHGARYELAQIQAQVDENQRRVEEAEAAAAVHRDELRAYAVEAYVRGGSEASEALLADTDPGDLGTRKGYLAGVSGDREQLIDVLRATEQDLQVQIAELETAKGAAEAKARDLEAREDAAQAAAAEQDRLYDQVQGEIAELVRQEQERRAAAERAAAESRARTSRAPALRIDGSGGPAPASRGDVSAVLAEAQRQLGKPYVWGAAGPDAFDCSGFTQWVWKAAGVYLPHYTGAQYAQTRHISMSEIAPGDLIFYGGDLGHVGLYVGGGQIIHAPNSRSSVRYDSIYYWNTSMVASRVA